MDDATPKVIASKAMEAFEERQRLEIETWIKTGGHQNDEGESDTDWPPVTSFEFDPVPLLEEAARVALRAQAAQVTAQGVAAPRQPQGTVAAKVSAVGRATLPWPPGRAGVIAEHLFATSYSPIPEVSIVATLGLLAGVCGRAYRTHTEKDLALYMILVAKSGVGKDAMHEGIPAMLRLADRPLAYSICRAQDFASGEALHKALLREPGFLYLQGEFGRKLKRMSNPTDAPMQSFRTIMTNAFGKRFLEGKEYSNPENSLNGVDWPALSFLGETTPGTFLECLTEDMMADGFMSRFLVVSYPGDRPLPNRVRNGQLPRDDLDHWRGLVDHALQYQFPISTPAAIVAKPTPEAEAMLDAFDLSCIANLNATDEESERQVWSRAHLKAMKVACLLAVADHYLVPTVRPEHVEWALALVRRDVEVFQSRNRNGDIGSGDNARERKLMSIIRDYILSPSIPPSYKVPVQMHKDGFIPRSYLQIRITSLPAFANHKLGATKALDEAMRSLAANGYVMEVKQDKVVEMYGHFGKTYRILDLPH
jgi:hypothetical protein